MARPKDDLYSSDRLPRQMVQLCASLSAIAVPTSLPPPGRTPCSPSTASGSSSHSDRLPDPTDRARHIMPLPPFDDRLRPHHRPVTAEADQRLTRCAAEGPQRGQVAHRLQEVRLARAVVADHHREPAGQFDVDVVPAPEVVEPEALQVHDVSIGETSPGQETRTGISR